VIAHLIRRGKGETAKFFLNHLHEAGIQVIEPTYLDLIEAFEETDKLKFNYSMWDDLAISCQMRRSGIKEIYTNDEDF